MGNSRTTWANLLGAEIDAADAPWEGNAVLIDGPPQPKSICYGPLAAAAPFISMGLTAASAGMSIIGASNQAAAQRQAGEIAYQNALQRNQMAQVQAQQLEANASNEQGAAQRVAEDQRRKGQVMASRIRAVMGASGAGEDPNLIASLEGEGNYNSNVALYNGDEKARGLRNQAALTRWGGQAGVNTGAYERDAGNRAADATMVGAIGKGVLSFASAYGGGLFKGGGGSSSGIDGDIASWSQYGQDPESRAALARSLA
jgi:hypothetical protein